MLSKKTDVKKLNWKLKDPNFFAQGFRPIEKALAGKYQPYSVKRNRSKTWMYAMED